MNFSRKELITKGLKRFLSKEYKKTRDWLFYWAKKIKPELNLDINLKGASSSKEIDLVFVCLPKDADTLRYGLSYIKESIKHPIKNTYLIGPESDELSNLCQEGDIHFILEKELIGYEKDKIEYVYNGLDRSGWLYQQLLKWKASDIVESSSYLVVDCDTFFIKDRVFENKGKLILDFADEYHQPYYDMYERLTGLKHQYEVSFVCHYMLIEKQKLKALQDLIKKRTNFDWDQAIISNIDQSQLSCFSEYETYANFVLQNWPSQYKLEYWFNESISKTKISFEDAKANSQPNTKSLSFHTYNA